jgi:hypothetical protein
LPDEQLEGAAADTKPCCYLVHRKKVRYLVNRHNRDSRQNSQSARFEWKLRVLTPLVKFQEKTFIPRIDDLVDHTVGVGIGRPFATTDWFRQWGASIQRASA